MVEYYELLECIAVLIGKGYVGILVIAVNLAAALVDGHEYRLQT